MDSITIKSFEEYKKFVDDKKYRNWIYRGQNNAKFKLESSLLRTINKNKELRHSSNMAIPERYEEAMINKVKKNCHLFLDKEPDTNNTFDWLSLMQHYGAPTRLLDFSYSPYIALYFAISGATENAAIYCVDTVRLKKNNRYFVEGYNLKYDDFIKPEHDIEKTMLIKYEPYFTNQRLFVQQGVFLLPNTLDFTHQEILETYDSTSYAKLEIDKKSFKNCLIELYKMNITASSIYPGFEGFCKSFENIGILSLQQFQENNELSDLLNIQNTTKIY